jgi:hypothetical protein
MKRTLLLLAVGALALSGAFADGAAASGPAGKNTVEIECEGLAETIVVRIPPSEHGNGAGQVVAQHLHGIPVSNTFTFTDVTKGFSETETETRGGGHGNHNQTTTTCTGTAFEGEAAQLFGEELPPNVEGSDTIRGEFEVQVVLKP